MDASVNTALDTLTTGLKTDSLSILTNYLPVAGAIMVTVAVLFFGVRIFRAIAHV